MNRSWWAVMAIAMAGGISAYAQTAPASTAVREIRYVTLLPGRTAEYRAAWKDYNELMAKAGSKQQTFIWQALTGEPGFRIVIPHESLAEMDTPPADRPGMKEYAARMQAITTRLAACIAHQRREFDQIDPELSTPIATPLAIVRIRQLVVRPDKIQEYRALLKADVMPAVKQAGGGAVYITSRVRLGARQNIFYTSNGVKSWADLDHAPAWVTAMGEAKYQAFQAKLNSFITSSEVHVYRYQPEMSYVPTTTSASR